VRIYADGSPIRVTTDGSGRPVAFAWLGRTYRVETIEDVREPRLDWWSATGEIHRVYYLVTTDLGLIADIYLDRIANRWLLARLYD
jgi:hypothetical protein